MLKAVTLCPCCLLLNCVQVEARRIMFMLYVVELCYCYMLACSAFVLQFVELRHCYRSVSCLFILQVVELRYCYRVLGLRSHFICRVLHSRPLNMSAVQVFFGDKMVAVSHLINCEQLPRPSQVSMLS